MLKRIISILLCILMITSTCTYMYCYSDDDTIEIPRWVYSEMLTKLHELAEKIQLGNNKIVNELKREAGITFKLRLAEYGDVQGEEVAPWLPSIEEVDGLKESINKAYKKYYQSDDTTSQNVTVDFEAFDGINKDSIEETSRLAWVDTFVPETLGHDILCYNTGTYKGINSYRYIEMKSGVPRAFLTMFLLKAVGQYEYDYFIKNDNEKKEMYIYISRSNLDKYWAREYKGSTMKLNAALTWRDIFADMVALLIKYGEPNINAIEAQELVNYYAQELPPFDPLAKTDVLYLLSRGIIDRCPDLNYQPTVKEVLEVIARIKDTNLRYTNKFIEPKKIAMITDDSIIAFNGTEVINTTQDTGTKAGVLISPRVVQKIALKTDAQKQTYKDVQNNVTRQYKSKKGYWSFVVDLGDTSAENWTNVTVRDNTEGGEKSSVITASSYLKPGGIGHLIEYNSNLKGYSDKAPGTLNVYVGSTHQGTYTLKPIQNPSFFGGYFVPSATNAHLMEGVTFSNSPFTDPKYYDSTRQFIELPADGETKVSTVSSKVVTNGNTFANESSSGDKKEKTTSGLSTARFGCLPANCTYIEVEDGASSWVETVHGNWSTFDVKSVHGDESYEGFFSNVDNCWTNKDSKIAYYYKADNGPTWAKNVWLLEQYSDDLKMTYYSYRAGSNTELVKNKKYTVDGKETSKSDAAIQINEYGYAIGKNAADYDDDAYLNGEGEYGVPDRIKKELEGKNVQYYGDIMDADNPTVVPASGYEEYLCSEGFYVGSPKDDWDEYEPETIMSAKGSWRGYYMSNDAWASANDLVVLYNESSNKLSIFSFTASGIYNSKKDVSCSEDEWSAVQKWIDSN